MVAKWLGWIDNAGRDRPLHGPHSVGDVVSHQAPVKRALHLKAAEIASTASLILDTRPKVRTGTSQVGMSKGELDWYVFLQDNTPGKSSEWRQGAAGGIEELHHPLRDAIRYMR